MNFAYPYNLEQIDSEYVVKFPDVPEALTGSSDVQEVELLAHDALIAALREYIENKEVIPKPSSPSPSQQVVYLTPLESAKLGLYIAKLENNLSNVELARKLGVNEKQVRRMLDLDHENKVDVIEKALREAFNYQLQTTMQKVDGSSRQLICA